MTDVVDPVVDTPVDAVVSDNVSVFGSLTDTPANTDAVVDTDLPTEEIKSDDSPVEELILGKFKTQEDLEKGYKELEGKFGGLSGAPEEYSLNTPEDINFTFYEGVDNDIEGFKGLAKELNLNQEGFDQVMDYYIKSEVDRSAMDVKARQEAAVQMFGGETKFNTEAKSYAAKVKATLGDDGLGLLQLATSASPDASGAVIKLVGQLLGKETAPLNSDTAVTAKADSRIELEEMMRDPRYKSDKQFREKVSRGFQALFG